MKTKFAILIGILAVLLVGLAGCYDSDPFTEDLYFENTIYGETFDAETVDTDALTLNGIELDEQLLFNYDEDLILYAPLWKLYGTSFLSEGLNPHLLTVTGATWGNTGYLFNGTSDKIVISAETALNTNGSAFSVDLWANITAYVNDDCLVSQREGAPGHTNNWQLIEVADGNLKVSIWIGGAEKVAVTTTPFASAGSFIHIAFTYDGTDVVFYKNGSLHQTIALSGSGDCDNNSISMLIGFDQYVGFFQGTVGEVRKYNQVLTATQVADIYNATSWRY